MPTFGGTLIGTQTCECRATSLEQDEFEKVQEVEDEEKRRKNEIIVTVVVWICFIWCCSVLGHDILGYGF